MNCCLWIIVLLACRGNCGGSPTRVCGCTNCKDDCMPVPFCDRRQNTEDERWMNGEVCDQRMERMDAEECGCVRNAASVRGMEENGCNEQRMSYETFGCQENGIPCPPPVPGKFMR